ncbi:MAG TPA: potassium-transporting ATPase subunit C [Thermoplasmata archaeon]|nr:potassium-transporting ATPase subunit C [Thermoplasmata archaeon]
MSRGTGTDPPGPVAPYAEPTASPAHSGLRHVRATVIFLVLAVLIAGVIYPLVVTGIADVVNPSGASGSLLRDPNGTVIGSSLIAQNTSAPYLFWSRPSQTDWNLTLGADTPPGPSDPALGQLLNETINYTGQAWNWNFSKNGSLPFWFIAPSSSDIDPDLVPQAVLIQVPRISAATNLSIERLTDLVNAHITNPVIPFIGVPYVNVLELDIALLPLIGR